CRTRRGERGRQSGGQAARAGDAVPASSGRRRRRRGGRHHRRSIAHRRGPDAEKRRGRAMRIQLKQVIPPVFWPVHQAIRSGTVREVVAKGGRGSGKSSYLSLELVYELLRRPDCHAVVLRKVAGTLRNSVYNQIVWAIGALGCAPYFRCTVSPMECTYLPTGQKILFFGLDDAGKLKSLKVPFGAVGLCWFEELDQFEGPEEVRSVEQSILRGGGWTLTLKSFNPPAMARSWVNRYALEPRPGK